MATDCKSEFICIGRRKTAVARVRLVSGNGKIKVNGKDFLEYFPTEAEQKLALAPLILLEMTDKVDIRILVNGGGKNGQAGALCLGIARALQLLDPELRHRLKKAGHLTRDPRRRERKKPGQPGARKRFQFSKR
ncbi:MAG: 30S ribosomal protein S9 [Puniceicoccales bacterium]|jgi:small subunit ribosomal protein S9|nr:30S ribosomal protein S9 [Puniceicoccales bacterium]